MEVLPEPTLIKDLGMMFTTENSKIKHRFGLYKCICGKEFKANTSSIKNGSSKSCGCYQKRLAKYRKTTHGLTNTRIWRIFNNMKTRTTNPKHKYYKNYGGRGITVCEEWGNIEAFNKWAMENGYTDELTIDRINNDLGYFPENCRWVTRIFQIRNQRISKKNTSGYKGVHLCKKQNKYRVRITVNYKIISLGVFPTALEGGIAYNNYIIENNLEGFILNEIK